MLKPFPNGSWILAAALAAASGACGGDIAAPSATPGPARMIVLSGDLQTGPPNQELPQPVAVQVLDDNGDPMPGQIVNFRVVEGNGSVFAGAALTNSQGIAKDFWTLGTIDGNTAGRQRLEVRAVDAETNEKQVFAQFRAFALAPATFSFDPPRADSTTVQVRWTFAPVNTYTYVWDLGDDTGTFRTSGTATLGALSVRVPNEPPRSYWFCYYALTPEGVRSAWVCSYFGAPFR
jgi:hypothetical protein